MTMKRTIAGGILPLNNSFYNCLATNSARGLTMIPGSGGM